METATEFGVHVGIQIKVARERIGLTQEELARKIGKSTQSISAYETGRRLIPMNELESLAKALDVSIVYFFKTPDTDQAKLETILSQKLSEMHPRFRAYTAVLIDILLEINHDFISQKRDIDKMDGYEFLQLFNHQTVTHLIGSTVIMETKFNMMESLLRQLIAELRLGRDK